jgi:hypothetical protein
MKLLKYRKYRKWPRESLVSPSRPNQREEQVTARIGCWSGCSRARCHDSLNAPENPSR